LNRRMATTICIGVINANFASKTLKFASLGSQRIGSSIGKSLNATRCFSTTPEWKKTSLNALHKQLGGQMVEFCGWEMPVKYEDSIVSNHLHVRAKAGLFDVSHMAQLKITGKDRVNYLEHLTVVDLVNLPANHAKLSVITNEKGGIIDDTVITNRGDHIYMVVNAGCAHKDIPHLQKHAETFRKKGLQVTVESIDRSLVALQGPSSEAILQKLVKEDITKMPFMTCKDLVVDGIPCLVSRCGYTGEDGFEISVAHENAEKLTKKLLSFADVKPAGLGVRDSLRLEAGLCLYGHDLEENITPAEAALVWTISKRRKEQGGFIGSEKILAQIKSGAPIKRIGLIGSGSPARENAPILDKNGVKIGHVTSGTFSPILKKPISMGFVNSSHSALSTEVEIEVRGKKYPFVVSKMPFVPSNYKRVE